MLSKCQPAGRYTWGGVRAMQAEVLNRKHRCACGWFGLSRDMRVKTRYREGVLVWMYTCWRCLRAQKAQVKP
jgi:hypothetical protein